MQKHMMIARVHVMWLPLLRNFTWFLVDITKLLQYMKLANINLMQPAGVNKQKNAKVIL